MAVSSKGRRIKEQRYAFLIACLVSLAGLIFYILGKHKIPFPSQWLANVEGRERKLLFLGIGVQLQVNFLLGFFFQFFLSEKTDQVKFKKWRYWITKILVFVGSLGVGLFSFTDILKSSWNDILLLSLIITVINCCLLELLVQLMNQYGICNAFNIMLLVEFLPQDLFQGELKPLSFLYLFFITVFFIWITNLKWEVPVDTNSLYSQDNSLLKKKNSKLGFKLSFSFMPLIYLSQFISFFYSLYLIKGRVNWFNLSEVSTEWGEAQKYKQQTSVNTLGEKQGFWSSLFTLNEEKRIFASKNIWDWISGAKWKIFGVLSFLLFLRWLVVWSQMRFVQWKPSEISKDLRKQGIYIDGLRPGRTTSNLLKIIINKLVFFWYVIVLFFNVVFDNLFSNLPFSNWFGGVNIGVDLIRQIRTKYRYIYAN